MSDAQSANVINEYLSTRGVELPKELNVEEVITRFKKTANPANLQNGRLSEYLAQRVLISSAQRYSAIAPVNAPAPPILEPNDFEGVFANSVQVKYKNSSKLLANMVGMKGIKKFLGDLEARSKVEKMRKKAGLPSTSPITTFHMIFEGPPGTGKTSIAGLVAKILNGLGILRTGQLVVARREDLVASYVGQTAPRTAAVIRSALGGVLFIDEAYHLSMDDRDWFSSEVIVTLLNMMETHRGDLVVILAGYKKEMDNFLDSNPGLRSRFSNIVMFDSFTPTELRDIGTTMFKEVGYEVTPEANNVLETITKELPQHSNGNARDVRNIVQQAILNHSQRLQNKEDATKEELSNLVPEDFKDVGKDKQDWGRWIL
eukprot:CAMPEP_0168508890 /NCGR_PEP_ID=MMETSP0405-20121227/409_1 /TAXON_ID=498012 /ORGANISM="Trichosphaerium sp, Strain Am-I-7 wt" /LENGTH=372 /DNA_ID=CAMNT_0008526163 /DNA_START=180 /DNA_END=1299 /DNA_ORIENTATION=-